MISSPVIGAIFSKADDYAPISVLAAHRHKAGQGMVSYRYFVETQAGNRSGTDPRTVDDILSEFMTAPVSLQTRTHLIGSMYALSDSLTFLLLLPYTLTEMTSRNTLGNDFTQKSQGWEDMRLVAIIPTEMSPENSHLHFGLSFPTGSTDKTDNGTPLPYALQTGSGTYDLLAGFTARSVGDRFSWGSQFSTIIRTGFNNNGYRLGNQYDATLWGSYAWSEMLSNALRVTFLIRDDMEGEDSRLNPPATSAATTNTGGQRIDLSTGMALFFPDGILGGHRIAVEAGAPIYQYLTGTQLETDWWFTAGWQSRL